MAWTDERVDELKKLWTEGLSASQIAARLGGVTRNAVIGKVHRLGLSGRANTSHIKIIRPKRKNPGLAQKPARAGAPSFGSVAIKTHFEPAYEPDLSVFLQPRAEDLAVPPENRVTMATLTECSCRWPIGDPASADFYFCGQKKVPGTPYCEFHARIAFQPASRNRRDGSADIARRATMADARRLAAV